MKVGDLVAAIGLDVETTLGRRLGVRYFGILVAANHLASVDGFRGVVDLPHWKVAEIARPWEKTLDVDHCELEKWLRPAVMTFAGPMLREPLEGP